MSRREEKRPELWHQPDYEKEDIRAVQSLMRLYRNEKDAEFTHADAKRFVDWLFYKAAGLREDVFFAEVGPNAPRGAREYMMGRQSVARNVAKLDSLKPEVFEK